MDELQAGIVKWFDDTKGYGFVTKMAQRKSDAYDIFIHKNNCKSPRLSESDFVLYHERTSTKQDGKTEAFDLIRLSDSVNKVKQIRLFIGSQIVYGDKIIHSLAGIYSNIENTILEEELLSICDKTVSIETFPTVKNCVSFAMRMIEQNKEQKFDKFFNTILNNSEGEIKIRLILWGIKFYQNQQDFQRYIPDIIQFYNDSKPDTKTYIVNRVSLLIRLKIFGLERIENEADYIKIKSLLRNEDGHNGYVELTNSIGIADEYKFKFWLDRYTDSLDIDYFTKVYYDNPDLIKKTHFTRLNENQRRDVYAKIYLDLEQRRPYSNDQFVFIYIDLIKQFDKELLSEYCKKLTNISSDHIKLRLWLNDLSSFFNLDTFRPLVILLSESSQKRFFKKLIHLKKLGQIDLTVDSLVELKDLFISYEENEQSGDQARLDYSISVLIQLIIDLKNKEQTKPERIYDLIAKQIRKPNDILKITGFFDKCEGRLMSTKTVENETEVFNVSNKRGPIPDFIEYCEGRLALNKDTKAIEKCELTGQTFYWCQNSKCYGACRTKHDNYFDYTLTDILEILNVSYNTEDYELLLGYLNKINRFLAHMNCRECGYLLRPTAQTNYAFYRVNNFKCPNENCSRHSEIIYLSHCLNGRCPQVVDSRDSVKCKPEGFNQDSCGWYICNFCHSCCSDRVLETRQYIYSKTGKQYNCHSKGHLDLGEICCSKCGSKMKQFESSQEKYNSILEGLKKLAEHQENVVIKSGQRNDEKWWFLLRAPFDDNKLKVFKSKLLLYKSNGFNVPDLEETKGSYLVGEPIRIPTFKSMVFKCSECDFVLDLSEDKFRYNAFKKYHKGIVV